MTDIYGILDTETNQFVCFGAKRAWDCERSAKSAYTYHKGRFAEQTRYKIVDLTEAYYRLEDLEK